MVEGKARRVEVQLAAEFPAKAGPPALAQVFLPPPAIFSIARDRAADRRHMRAKLMRASGDGAERDSGKPWPRLLDHAVIGDGGACALRRIDLVRVDGVDALMARTARFHEPIADGAGLRIGPPGDGGEIDALDIARAEKLAKPGRRRPRPRQHQ